MSANETAVNEKREAEPTVNQNVKILESLNDGSLGKVEDVKLRGTPKKVAGVIFTIISIGVVLYTMGIAIFGTPTVMVHRISHLAIILFVTPMFYPSKVFKEGSKIELCFNIFCTAVGIVAALYAFTHWQAFYSYKLSPVDVLMLSILILAVLECTRRAIGLPMVVISLVAILYCLFGQFMPSALAHKGYTLTKVINMICVGTEGLFSSTLGTASVEIAAFLIFSSLLQCSGALTYFMRLAFSIAGGYAGGPAKVSIVSSALMGTVSGSTVANVTATGSITIPLMKLMGFEPEYAGGVEAVSSAGGSITPPVLGATAFLIAEFLDIGYWQVSLAAIIPAVLYYISLFNSVHTRSVKNKMLGINKADLPGKLQSFKDCIFLILPIVTLVVLMAKQFSALYAAFWAIIVLLIVANFKKDTRLNLKMLRKVARLSLKTMIPVSTACATAGIIVATLSMTGLGQKMGSVITLLSGGNLVLALVLTQIAALVLGTGLVTPATYTLLAVLCAPALINMGANSVATHLFIFHFAILGTLTPPVSLAAFAAAGIAGSNPIRTGLTAFRLALPGFLVPYFFVLNPTLIGQGSILNITIDVITAIIGVMFMGYALEGFMRRKLNLVTRLLCGVGGVALVFPSVAFSVAGVALILVALLLMKIASGQVDRGVA